MSVASNIDSSSFANAISNTAEIYECPDPTHIQKQPKNNSSPLAYLPRMIIVSDVTLFRDGIIQGFMDINTLEIVDSVTSVQALSSIGRYNPDGVILDVTRAQSLSLSRQIKDLNSDLCLIGFGVGDHQEVIACAEAGLSAFVGQNGSIAELNDAALRALRGELICSPKLAARLVRHIAALADYRIPSCDAHLTGRENEVAIYVERGLSNKEIALKLGISPATVKNHVHMILEKLNVPRRSRIGKTRN
jgi:two-component system, NarL family, nitrate/nitrite response regulator NarL